MYTCPTIPCGIRSYFQPILSEWVSWINVRRAVNRPGSNSDSLLYTDNAKEQSMQIEPTSSPKPRLKVPAKSSPWDLNKRTPNHRVASSNAIFKWSNVMQLVHVICRRQHRSNNCFLWTKITIDYTIPRSNYFGDKDENFKITINFSFKHWISSIYGGEKCMICRTSSVWQILEIAQSSVDKMTTTQRSM